jgi:hypothetical protein
LPGIANVVKEAIDGATSSDAGEKAEAVYFMLALVTDVENYMTLDQFVSRAVDTENKQG